MPQCSVLHLSLAGINNKTKKKKKHDMKEYDKVSSFFSLFLIYLGKSFWCECDLYFTSGFVNSYNEE